MLTALEIEDEKKLSVRGISVSYRLVTWVPQVEDLIKRGRATKNTPGEMQRNKLNLIFDGQQLKINKTKMLE